jgi:hypothetical protein
MALLSGAGEQRADDGRRPHPTLSSGVVTRLRAVRHLAAIRAYLSPGERRISRPQDAPPTQAANGHGCPEVRAYRSTSRKSVGTRCAPCIRSTPAAAASGSNVAETQSGRPERPR